jgi:hypothetical protein
MPAHNGQGVVKVSLQISGAQGAGILAVSSSSNAPGGMSVEVASSGDLTGSGSLAGNDLTIRGRVEGSQIALSIKGLAIPIDVMLARTGGSAGAAPLQAAAPPPKVAPPPPPASVPPAPVPSTTQAPSGATPLAGSWGGNSNCPFALPYALTLTPLNDTQYSIVGNFGLRGWVSGTQVHIEQQVLVNHIVYEGTVDSPASMGGKVNQSLFGITCEWYARKK